MTPQEAKHLQCTAIRASAYGGLFGGKPVAAFPYHKLQGKSDGPYLIDVFVYAMEMAGDDRAIYAAVTNGMSDQRMAEGDSPDQPRRRELIQYFRECTEGHAKRLRDMAWLPLHDGFLVDARHTVAWEWPAVEGSPWKNAFFLLPLLKPHREFTFEIEGDQVSFPVAHPHLGSGARLQAGARSRRPLRSYGRGKAAVDLRRGQSTKPRRAEIGPAGRRMPRFQKPHPRCSARHTYCLSGQPQPPA